jgi:hypothetical protein
MYLRKSQFILEELEIDNQKIQGDFNGLLQYLNEMAFRLRRQINKEKDEKYIKNNDQGRRIQKVD